MKKLLDKLTGRRQLSKSPLKVLFLNTRDSLGADVAVHLSLASTLDRNQAGVWAATGIYEAPGTSTKALLNSIPDLTVLEMELGRPLKGQRGFGRVMALLHSGRAIISLLRLAWLCRRQKISLIHVTERPRDMLFGFLLARLGGSACLLHAHTSYDRRNITRLGNWILHHADAIVGVSQFTADTYRHQAGLPANKVFAVHNAVDSAIFRPDIPVVERLAMRKRFNLPVEAPLIGCVARLSRWKDQATLLEALAALQARLPATRLVLAGINSDSAPDGNGDYRAYLMRRAAELGLEKAVTFSGFLPYHEMPQLYSAFDVLAHPAVEEPFGLAVVEAMASARPVVAVAEGGVLEIIRNGLDGLLVPRKQPAAMAAAILAILSDADLAGQLANAGRERVRAAFTPQLQAAAMLEVYRKVVATRRG